MLYEVVKLTMAIYSELYNVTNILVLWNITNQVKRFVLIQMKNGKKFSVSMKIKPRKVAYA